MLAKGYTFGKAGGLYRGDGSSRFFPAKSGYIDGQGFFPMREGDRVHIQRHPEPYPLLSWRGLDPYRRLRERLGWSGVLAPAPAPPRGTHSDPGHGGVL